LSSSRLSSAVLGSLRPASLVGSTFLSVMVTFASVLECL
jgi:hypothetical protein